MTRVHRPTNQKKQNKNENRELKKTLQGGGGEEEARTIQ